MSGVCPEAAKHGLQAAQNLPAQLEYYREIFTAARLTTLVGGIERPQSQAKIG